MSSDRWPNGTPKIPPQMCLNCGYWFDAASPAKRDDHMPKPDNVSLCLNCGEIAIFDEFLRLRPPTPTEMADPELQEIAARGKRTSMMHSVGIDLRKKRGDRA